MKGTMILLLDNIRSAHNVGSIFRTADAAGVSKIIIAGITPAPLDRFGRVRKDIAKVSLGAEATVPWEYASDTVSAIRALKKQGFHILALEQHDHAIDYKKIKLPKKAVLVVGNEVGGVSHAALKYSDTICEIPMKGKKESLNVSVATGIALFRLLKI